MTSLLKTTALAAVFLLGGCAASAPLSPQERVFQESRQACTEQTNAMIGGGPYSWNNQLPWDDYFEWCMEGKGYTKAQLKHIWY